MAKNPDVVLTIIPMRQIIDFYSVSAAPASRRAALTDALATGTLNANGRFEPARLEDIARRDAPPLFHRLSGASIGRHSLVSQLLDGLRGLCEVCQAHASQDMRCLGELDVVVADDLDAVAPRVEEVQESAR